MQISGYIIDFSLSWVLIILLLIFIIIYAMKKYIGKK